MKNVSLLSDNIEERSFMVSREYGHFQHNGLVGRKQNLSGVCQIFAVEQSKLLKKCGLVPAYIGQASAFGRRAGHLHTDDRAQHRRAQARGKRIRNAEEAAAK